MKRLISGVFCAVFVCAGAFAAEAVYYFDPGTGTEKSANGVFEVPASGKQGFFILQSKGVPTDMMHAPLVIPGRTEE